MKRNAVLVIGLLVGLASLAGAQGMMGPGGMSANGTGMLVVASDGSLLVTQMGMSMMGSPGGGSGFQRVIVNVGTDGTERWRAPFTDGWPMMAASDGDLVVVVLVHNSWMWQSMSGMGWWPWGAAPSVGNDDAELVGLDLASGAERWRAALPGDMASLPQFSPDGSRVHVSTTDFGPGGMMGSGPVRQGDTGGWATQMVNRVVALSRNGAVLWTFDLSTGGHTGGGMP
jgi:hypothetical protein